MGEIIQSDQLLSSAHVQFFLYQILRGMKYVHSARVMHRDMKPRNLLVNDQCDLKICDFGLARMCFSEQEWACPETEYVCTRWYRAPEVLCSWGAYSCAMDIWSIGCIFIELATRSVLFPGRSTHDQLHRITAFLGPPSEEELMAIPNKRVRNSITSLTKRAPTPLRDVLREIPPDGCILCEKMLRWDQLRRCTACEAIEHPYFEQLQCTEDEPTRGPLDTADFEFERRRLDTKVLRAELFREVLRYHPDAPESSHTGSKMPDIMTYPFLKPGEPPYISDKSDEEEGVDYETEEEEEEEEEEEH
eukprot:NODE_2036_length_1009_cov_430.009434.p1 GENE.NODE_2036_length_1009_cov_430.009434~~NODE_2036_length_1009_cov_430.009434.p1  ORF type:complete len:304 (+),score=87.99 NODE_2036_length_1009_cov_430.009434:3-914(+)